VAAVEDSVSSEDENQAPEGDWEILEKIIGDLVNPEQAVDYARTQLGQRGDEALAQQLDALLRDKMRSEFREEIAREVNMIDQPLIKINLTADHRGNNGIARLFTIVNEARHELVLPEIPLGRIFDEEWNNEFLEIFEGRLRGIVESLHLDLWNADDVVKLFMVMNAEILHLLQEQGIGYEDDMAFRFVNSTTMSSLRLSDDPWTRDVESGKSPLMIELQDSQRQHQWITQVSVPILSSKSKRDLIILLAKDGMHLGSTYSIFEMPDFLRNVEGVEEISVLNLAETSFAKIPGREVEVSVRASVEVLSDGRGSLTTSWEPSRVILFQETRGDIVIDESITVTRPADEDINQTMEELIQLMASRPELTIAEGSFDADQLTAIQEEFSRAEIRLIENREQEPIPSEDLAAREQEVLKIAAIRDVALALFPGMAENATELIHRPSLTDVLIHQYQADDEVLETQLLAEVHIAERDARLHVMRRLDRKAEKIENSFAIGAVLPEILDPGLMPEFLKGFLSGLDRGRIGEILQDGGKLPDAFVRQLKELGISLRNVQLTRAQVLRGDDQFFVPVAHLDAQKNTPFHEMFRPLLIDQIEKLKGNPDALKWLGKLTSRALLHMADLLADKELKTSPVLLKAELLRRLNLEGFDDLISLSQKGGRMSFEINAVAAKLAFEHLVRESIAQAA